MGPDPKLYRELSVPFASAEESDQATEAFLREMEELRKKHRICDLYLIIGLACLADEGDEYDYILATMYGNQLRAPALTAYAFGQEQVRAEQGIKDMVVMAAKMARKKAKECVDGDRNQA